MLQIQWIIPAEKTLEPSIFMHEDKWVLLVPRVFDDPRSCQMDGRVISTHKGS